MLSYPLPNELRVLSKDDCADGERALLVCGAGFEDRSSRSAQLLVSSNTKLVGAVVLRFAGENQTENESGRRAIQEALSAKLSQSQIVEGWMDRPEASIEKADALASGTVLVDVSSLPHSAVLQVLRHFSAMTKQLRVLYTEAESYYPTKEAAQQYLVHDDDETAFLAACRQEDAEVMFGGNTKVSLLPGFEGRLLPTSQTAIVLFPTYKRLRTSSVLAELEVHRKVIIFGNPIRPDLDWRARALRIVNLDMVDDGTDVVRQESTLSPAGCFHTLEDLVANNILPVTWNILICPHGSKMQSVAVWGFCTRHRDVRVVISRPTKFYPKKYSSGVGDTFMFDISAHWPWALTGE